MDKPIIWEPPGFEEWKRGQIQPPTWGDDLIWYIILAILIGAVLFCLYEFWISRHREKISNYLQNLTTATKVQRATILIGVAVIVTMTLYPPWSWRVYSIETEKYGLYGQQQQQKKYYYETSAGYCWLFSPPDGYTRSGNKLFGNDTTTTKTPSIDFSRLILQYLAVMVASAGAYWVSKRRA